MDRAENLSRGLLPMIGLNYDITLDSLRMKF
jgi:hypothetical protein